jgi:hypothetical protein
VFNSAEQAKEVLLPVRHFAYSRDLDIPFEENQKLFQFFTKSKDKKFFVLGGLAILTPIQTLTKYCQRYNRKDNNFLRIP